MTNFIKTAKESRSAIGDRVEWFDKSGSHHAGRLTDVSGIYVQIDGANWISRKQVSGLKLHRMYDKK